MILFICLALVTYEKPRVNIKKNKKKNKDNHLTYQKRN